jgi:two-component system, OmpR family, response regulator
MSKNDKRTKIYSALEVANICGVVNQTAINWIRSGYLKAFTTPGGQYRVYSEDLVEFLEGRGMRIPEEVVKGASLADWDVAIIVDDDVDLNNLLKRMLEKKLPGMEFLQAFDGFEAGRQIAARKPGFIVLDIDLPGVNGHEICKKIKKDPGFGDPFIVVVTGLDPDESRELALAEGADAFFSKPLEFPKVVTQIKEFSGKVNRA